MQKSNSSEKAKEPKVPQPGDKIWWTPSESKSIEGRFIGFGVLSTSTNAGMDVQSSALVYFDEGKIENHPITQISFKKPGKK